MGLLDFLFGGRSRQSAGAGSTAMQSNNSDWVLVEGGAPDDIRSSVIEYSRTTEPVQPSRHSVKILKLSDARYGVTFDPAVPPYVLTNLIGWLDDPRMTQGARRAVGWLVSPHSGVRYFLAPERDNAGGDTLLGVGSDGGRVTVFLPDCTVSASGKRVTAVPEPKLPDGAELAAAFEITLDGDPSFGNPQFLVG